jgi:hypothetical protein
MSSGMSGQTAEMSSVLDFLGADILFGFLISSLIEQAVLRWRNLGSSPERKNGGSVGETFITYPAPIFHKKFKNCLIF